MDNEKIAKELVAVAKELTAVSGRGVNKRITLRGGDAYASMDSWFVGLAVREVAGTAAKLDSTVKSDLKMLKPFISKVKAPRASDYVVHPSISGSTVEISCPFSFNYDVEQFDEFEATLKRLGYKIV